MDHYVEIKILPNPEFTSPIIMNVLYGKLHNALVAQSGGMVGVSFPDWDQDKPSLGSRLRLHGAADTLNRLMAKNWLAGARDHFSVNKLKMIPATARHRVVSRVQVKSNAERLRRRMVKRHGVSEEEARLAIPDEAAKMLSLPFVSLKSQSTRQPFRLFIEQQPIQSNPVGGEFNRYGLSSKATIPWF